MKKRQFLILAIILGMVGCRLSEDDKGTFVRVTPDFSVKLFEELGDTRQFQFLVSTIENQPCENATINYSTQNYTGNVSLWLYGISEPENCIATPAQAKITANVGFLNNGDYAVRLNLKNAIENNGKLKVRDEAYTLMMESHDGLELPYLELRRIPAKIIWGYIAYNDKNAVGDSPDNFIKDLVNLSQNASLTTGYYGYFSIESGIQGPVFDPKPGFNYFKTFVHKYNGEKQNLESLLEFYRSSAAGNHMTIKLYTWEGEIF
jgi:hypothetical protein